MLETELKQLIHHESFIYLGFRSLKKCIFIFLSCSLKWSALEYYRLT